MNRETRRDMMKKGVTQGTIDNLEFLEKPCSIKEVVSLSQGVAQDVFLTGIEEFRGFINPTIVSLTLWVETLKDIITADGIRTPEQLQEAYEDHAADFQKKSEEFLKAMEESKTESTQEPKLKMVPQELDMKVVRKEN